MQELFRLTKARAESLKAGIKKAERDAAKLPEGRLRSSKGKRQRRFFRVIEKNDTSGSYLRASEKELIMGLAQSDYRKQYLKVAKAELKVLEDEIKLLSAGGVEAVFDELPEYRKELVTPYYTSDQLYAAAWQAERFRTNIYRTEERKYKTRRGDMVRSKSEAIIADMLYELRIPYHYEKALRLSTGEFRYPDFTLLKVSERKDYYLEHFGLFDDAWYRSASLRKLNEYNANGIYTGKNLILTFETTDNPLDIEGIRQMLSNIFCN